MTQLRQLTKQEKALFAGMIAASLSLGDIDGVCDLIDLIGQCSVEGMELDFSGMSDIAKGMARVVQE